MTENRLLPPAAEACLCQAYPSSQKGGTLIAEEVQDLESHEQRLWDPDSYRPQSCPRCGSGMHVHDLRPRQLLGDPALSTEVLRFRCADRERCGAAWQILPGFLARHLWRSWWVVEKALEEPRRGAIPARTLRRFRFRLACAARLLVVILTTAVEATWCALGSVLGLDARRLDLVRVYGAQWRPEKGRCLAQLAGALHRLSPGVRLM